MSNITIEEIVDNAAEPKAAATPEAAATPIAFTTTTSAATTTPEAETKPETETTPISNEQPKMILGYIRVDCVALEGNLKGKITLFVHLKIKSGNLEKEIVDNNQMIKKLITDAIEKLPEKYIIIKVYNWCLGEYIEPIFNDARVLII